jgi:hypothetical protein
MKKRVRQLVGFGGVERERERESIWDWWRKWPAYRNLHEAIKSKILSCSSIFFDSIPSRKNVTGP